MLFWALFDSLVNSDAKLHDAIITNGTFLMDAELQNPEEIGMFKLVITGLYQLAKKYDDQVKIIESECP